MFTFFFQGKGVGVVGSVGSGKTTLLNSIMAEVIKEEGIVAVSNLHEGNSSAYKSLVRKNKLLQCINVVLIYPTWCYDQIVLVKKPC